MYSSLHCNDVIMASQITSPTIVYSTVYSGADQRKHQSCASLAFVRGIHRSTVNSPHKWPVTRKMFPFDVVVMCWWHRCHGLQTWVYWYTNQPTTWFLPAVTSSLTHLPLDKMTAIAQTILSDAFLWMKSFVFWWKFHWSLFIGVQLTINQHWFR